jgi:uncharacterized FAD-dependent dehydrogenase
MIKLDQLKMPIGFCEQDILQQCALKLKIKQNQIKNFFIVNQSIDARRKPKVFFVLAVALELDENLEKQLEHLKYEHSQKMLNYQPKNTQKPPVVVGFGPAGMFCALALAKMGLRPIVIEQGKPAHERAVDVELFWKKGILNPHSNVQFGEGGAGTFSDGKLNTNLSNHYCNIVINEFVNAGAPKQIAYISKPHIGSDKLRDVVVDIRKQIIALGGQVLFCHKLVEIKFENSQITDAVVQDVQNGTQKTLATDHLVLCVGHSARDCFEMLHSNGVQMVQKPFAMGVRIEQDQHKINQAQYGINYDKRLPNADYKLAVHLPNGRSVFTFCMCPGGQVVASSTSEGEIVTNGMSYFARDGKNSNSAVLVNVKPQDYGSTHPLAGVEFQKKYEKLAFEIGGANFKAPAQTVGSFLSGNYADKFVEPTYRPGVHWTQIEKCLPDFVSDSLKQGLPLLDQKLKGFADGKNVLIAIESRSSCPLTIVRDQTMQSNIKGLYPCGEGAGYAGGIMSAAVDGIKVAEALYNSIK